MANLIRKQEPRGLRRGTEATDPWRMMRNMLRWDPFAEMEPSMLAGLVRGQQFMPSIDVRETKDSYVIEADLPGMHEEDVEVSVTGHQLTISGERSEEEKHEDERYFSVERSYGSFSRTFTLPEGVDPDRVNAELRNGVLCVNVPKKPEMQAKKIQIEAKGKQAEQVHTQGKQAEQAPAESKKPKAA